MKILVIILLISASVANVSAEPVGNEYGFANAWFNGQEATVKDVKLKIGEPADIKVTVTSNISGNVYVELSNPLVTEAYTVIRGPSKIGEFIDNYDINAGWSKTYQWTISPSGAWKNGNAPINLLVSFSKKGNQKEKEFTIANPYILDEQYTGASPTQSQPPAPQPKSTPFPSVLLALGMTLAAWWLGRGR